MDWRRFFGNDDRPKPKDREQPNERHHSAPREPALRIARDLSDPDREKRKHAINDLISLGSAAASVVPEVLPLLTHSDKNIRRDVVQAIGQIGELSKPALPTLVERLGDDDPGVWRVSRIALLQVDPGADVLLRALGHENARIRQSALDAIPRLATMPEPPVKALIARLSDGAEIKQRVTDMLIKIGKPAVAPLADAVSDDQLGVNVLDVLAAMKGTAAPAVPKLIEVVQASPTLGAHVARTLGEIGAASVPALADILADTSLDSAASEVIRAVAQLRETAAPLVDEVPNVARRLPRLVPEVVRTLGSIGNRSRLFGSRASGVCATSTACCSS